MLRHIPKDFKFTVIMICLLECLYLFLLRHSEDVMVSLLFSCWFEFALFAALALICTQLRLLFHCKKLRTFHSAVELATR